MSSADGEQLPGIGARLGFTKIGTPLGFTKIGAPLGFTKIGVRASCSGIPASNGTPITSRIPDKISVRLLCANPGLGPAR